jgi:phenylacetate-coenzyme A ligase PaaK-like adenylate-forming protein
MTAYWDAELETMPWEELRRWQAGQAGTWLAALPGRSRFHRDKLSGARLPERPADPGFLADLPFTTKEELRVSQQEGRPGEPFGRHQGVPLAGVTQVLSSSGTTGDPLNFALTAADLEVWREGIATGFYAAGVRDHDVVAHLVGLPGVAGGLPYADGFRRIGAALAWIGGRPTEQIVRSIPLLQATTVLATSSFGTYLADRCRELTGSDASSLGVRSLLGGGEPGLAQPEIREKVRAGWGLERVHEVMGLGDVMSLLWAECEDEGGMHFCGQRSVMVELVDPATGAVVPWREGAEGEAVYTTFAREATPVLRYRSADHMVVKATACPCGRTAPRVRCVGRTDDMLIYKAMNVFPSAIRDVVLDRFPGSVEPYLRIWKDDPRQVRFDDPIAVDVEASRELSAERYRDVAVSIERELRARLQVQTTVTLLEPGALPRTAYKTPLVHVRDGGA